MSVPSSSRRVVYVVGSGRSGTSTMAGTLRTLGLTVPQPEVAADSTNPKGFGEPQWLVDTHDELLKRSGVQVSDARPRAWLDAGKVTTDHALRERVTAWLGEQLERDDELVLKDPRASWFLGLWRAAAERSGATTAYVTMLRPVTEVVGSKQKYYDARQGGVTRTAAWVNMMLGTERATRGERRAFVRYGDMLSDWTVPVFALGEQFDLHGVKTAMASDIAAVHSFIDPSLRRVTLTWDDVVVPAPLRELADETWAVLDALAEPGGDTVAAHETCDQLRVAYGEMYSEAEAFAASSVLAARRDGVRQGREEASRPAGGAAGGAADRAADRSADRVPHAVRALVPPAARTKIRKVIGRER